MASKICVAQYLGDDAYRLPETFQADVPCVLASHINISLLRLIEAKQQPDYCAFPKKKI